MMPDVSTMHSITDHEPGNRVYSNSLINPAGPNGLLYGNVADRYSGHKKLPVAPTLSFVGTTAISEDNDKTIS